MRKRSREGREEREEKEDRGGGREGGREGEDEAGWGKVRERLVGVGGERGGGDERRRADEWRASLSPMRWPITA